MAFDETKQTTNETGFDMDYLLRNYALGVQPTVDDIAPFDNFVQSQNISQAEIERFKNEGVITRVFNHLLAGVSLGLYNPYKVSPEEAEQDNWMYKRFIRVPILEDLVSPYGFSVAGAIESLPILALGGISKAIGGLVGLGKVGEKVDKLLTSGIRFAEKIGVSALDKTSGFLASKVPLIEKEWMSLSPQVRKIGYDIIKKDLQFAPWVAGASYREKSLHGENASRLQEYMSALYNPVNLLFASGFAGIEAKIATKGLMAEGKTFWDALGELQKLDDLRKPMINATFVNLAKDGLVEKNPLAFKSLVSYIDNLGSRLDAQSIEKASDLVNLSPEAKKIITKDGLISYTNSLLKKIPENDFIINNILQNPVEFLKRDFFSDVSNGEKLQRVIGNYSSSLAKLSELSSSFFDNVLVKNKPIMDILSKNPDVATTLAKERLDVMDKTKIVDFFIKQNDLVDYVKSIPEIKNFLDNTTSVILDVSNKAENIINSLNSLNPDNITTIKNSILKSAPYLVPTGNMSIIPVGDVSSVVSGNITIPSKFVDDVMEAIREKRFINDDLGAREDIKNLIKTRELWNYLKNNTTPESLAKLSRQYPEYLGITPEDALKIENTIELAKVDNVIKDKVANSDLVNKIVEKQYTKIGVGIEKDDGIELAKKAKIIMTDLYDELQKIPEFNNMGKEMKMLFKDYLSKNVIINERGEQGFGATQKFLINYNIWKGKISNDVNLYVSKVSSDILNFFSDLPQDDINKMRSEIVEYFIGNKKFEDVKAFKKVFEEMKFFDEKIGSFNKKNFYNAISEFPDKIKKRMSMETEKEIFDSSEFVNGEVGKYFENIFSNATQEEVAKIIQNEVELKKNVLTDELKNGVSNITQEKVGVHKRIKNINQ